MLNTTSQRKWDLYIMKISKKTKKTPIILRNYLRKVIECLLGVTSKVIECLLATLIESTHLNSLKNCQKTYQSK